MSKLPNSLKTQAKKYSQLTDPQKLKLLDELYHQRKLSWGVIADLCETYANKVRRDAKKLGIQSRSKADAQSLALSTGRHSHPTEGKGHSEATRIKISDSVAEDWEQMDNATRDLKKQEARDRWNEKSEAEVQAFRTAANEGIRRAAVEGSALEHYLHQGLVRQGYTVEFHKEHWVIREKLQIDLFLPDINVAIEVDGPSHFDDIWGGDVLSKNQLRDNIKNGLLLQRGCVIIRVRQTKSLSQKFKRDTLRTLLDTLQTIETKKPAKGKRVITIGE